MSDSLRRPMHYQDASGRPPDPAGLRRHLTTTAPRGLAVSGVVAARHHDADFDLNGLPRPFQPSLPIYDRCAVDDEQPVADLSTTGRAADRTRMMVRHVWGVRHLWPGLLCLLTLGCAASAASVLPPRHDPIGTPNPTLLLGAARDGSWVAICQSRADTNHDGRIAFHF